MAKKKNIIDAEFEIVPDKTPNLTGGKTMKGFLKALNPLGPIADTISSIFDYKEEIRKMEMEVHRINTNAEITHKHIDASLKLSLTRLTEDREKLKMMLDVVSKEFDNHHIERMCIVRSVENLTKLLEKKNVTSEERLKAIETLPYLTQALASSGESDFSTIKQLALATQKQLESVPALKLLPDKGETE